MFQCGNGWKNLGFSYSYHGYHRFQQLLPRDFHPCHFNCVWITRWARSQEVIYSNFGVISWWTSYLIQIKYLITTFTAYYSLELNRHFERHTRLKWVADWTFRTGCIRASLTIMLISAPEYPSVFLPRVLKSDSLRLLGVEPRWSLNMKARACSSGSGI